MESLCRNKIFRDFDNFTDEWKSRNFKKIEENTAPKTKPSTSESKSRTKKNIGNIQSFLKRNYGLIHNTKTMDWKEPDRIAKIKSEFSILSQEYTNKRPMTAFRQIKSCSRLPTEQIINRMPKLSEQQLAECGLDTNKILDNIVKWIRLEWNTLVRHSSKENAKCKATNKAKSITHISKAKLTPSQLYSWAALGTEEIVKKLEYFLTLVVPTIDIDPLSNELGGSALDQLNSVNNTQNNQFIKSWIRDNPILQKEIEVLTK